MFWRGRPWPSRSWSNACVRAARPEGDKFRFKTFATAFKNSRAVTGETTRSIRADAISARKRA